MHVFIIVLTFISGGLILLCISVCCSVYVSSWPISARSVYHLGCSKPWLRRPLFFSWTLWTLSLSSLFTKVIVLKKISLFQTCPAHLWSRTKSPFPLDSISGASPKKFPANCWNCDFHQIYAACFFLELWYSSNICSSLFNNLVPWLHHGDGPGL